MTRNSASLLVKWFIALTVLTPIFLVTLLYAAGCFSLKSYSELAKAELISDSINYEWEHTSSLFSYMNYTIDIQYNYRYRGEEYSSDKVGIGYPQWRYLGDIQLFIDKILTEGVVYVDSVDPKTAYLISFKDLPNMVTVSSLLIFVFLLPLLVVVLFIYEASRSIVGITFRSKEKAIVLSLLTDLFFFAYLTIIVLLTFNKMNLISSWMTLYQHKYIEIVSIFFITLFVFFFLSYERSIGQIITGLYYFDYNSGKQPTIKQLSIRKLLVLLTFGLFYIHPKDKCLYDKKTKIYLHNSTKIENDYYLGKYLFESQKKAVIKKLTIADYILYGVLGLVCLLFFGLVLFALIDTIFNYPFSSKN